jgi:ribosome-associated translation inhibitor RaiA
MRPAKSRHEARTIIDAHNYRVSAAEERIMRSNLNRLRPQFANFPVADSRIVIEGNKRTGEVGVKLTLQLPGTTLVVSDHAATLQPAFERCLDTLRSELDAYKGRLGSVAARQKAAKGTYQELHPESPIDEAVLADAVAHGDYVPFRRALVPFEEGLRRLVGRWVQRYPSVDGQIGDGLQIDDIVEEVFLLAFDGYERRPEKVALGNWLRDQIDPAVRALLRNQAEELENIALVRSLPGVPSPWA